MEFEDKKEAETPEDEKQEASRIIGRWESLDTQASGFKIHWQDCYENIVPRKEDVNSTRSDGDERATDLYDTTAVLANEMLASALHGMLTNPETRFFDATYGDPVLDNDPEVQAYCQDIGERAFRVLNNSNFQTEIYEIYVDLGAIGTACLYMDEDPELVVNFSARAMKEIRIDENQRGLIDTVYRSFSWKAPQIVSEWGEKNVPEKIVRAAEKNLQDKFEIIHAVEALKHASGRSKLSKDNPKKHAFLSTYVLKSDKHVLSEDGYREFPYAVPRWSKTSGEIYGRGPGMSTLADIRMVNSMMLTVIQGAQLTVAPPFTVTDDGVVGVVRLTPAGVTIVRAGSEVKPLITNARIDFGQQMLEDVRNRIRAGFYVDQLQLKDGPQMTAEEVRERSEQRLRLMGPVLGRQHFELLRPMFTRLISIMDRRGMLPEAPAKVKGRKLDVRYSSLIARAQRVSEGQNLVRVLQILEPMSKIMPEVIQGIKGDDIVRYIWSVYGLRHDQLLTARALEQKRGKIAQMQAEQMKMQQEQHQAEVAKKTVPAMQAMKGMMDAQQNGGGM